MQPLAKPIVAVPGEISPHTMKTALDAFLIFAALLFSSIAFGIDWTYVGMAAGGSFFGSVALLSNRREPSLVDWIFKFGLAMSIGMIGGSCLQEYLQVTNPKYIVGLFFVSGLLSLGIVKAGLAIFEANATDILKQAIQRFLGLKLKTDGPQNSTSTAGASGDEESSHTRSRKRPSQKRKEK